MVESMLFYGLALQWTRLKRPVLAREHFVLVAGGSYLLRRIAGK